jgi:uncharacterized metal-binding protein YceD (DUF177 family)
MAGMTDPEFSRPVRIDTLGEGARAIAIEADEGERAALARRFGLIAIERLEAKAEVRAAGEAVLASGRLTAAVTQACVASGEPVPAVIDEPFDLRFVPEGGKADEEIELEEGDLDVIGYEGSAIDLGEAAAQTLALALDPFPRAPNAEEILRAAGVVDETEVGPFSALKGLKDLLK